MSAQRRTSRAMLWDVWQWQKNSAITYLTVCQLFVNPCIVTQSGHWTHNLRVHLWSQSFYQLRNKLISQLTTFLSDNLYRDEIAWTFKHFLEFFLKIMKSLIPYILNTRHQNHRQWTQRLRLPKSLTEKKLLQNANLGRNNKALTVSKI